MNNERNPDINLDSEEVPAGMILVTGLRLMGLARREKIPFGLAWRRDGSPSRSRRATVGLILRAGADEVRFEAALEHQAERLLHRAGRDTRRGWNGKNE
jgi:hypothetical protein